ncbi:hypothetical protein BBX50_12980 [Ensifer sp. LC11]|nr:hypothetical protein BBX50_12980 [Ensifer sp. LC11]
MEIFFIQQLTIKASPVVPTAITFCQQLVVYGNQALGFPMPRLVAPAGAHQSGRQISSQKT